MVETLATSDKIVKIKTVDNECLEVQAKLLQDCQYFTDYFEAKDEIDEELDMTDLEITKEEMQYVVDFSKILQVNKPPLISKPIKHTNMYEITTPVFASFTD